jgi:hypothetical protein
MRCQRTRLVTKTAFFDDLTLLVHDAVAAHLVAQINSGKVRGRREELKAELKRLTAAVAETGHSSYLLQAIADRERELSDLVDRQLVVLSRLKHAWRGCAVAGVSPPLSI